MQLKLKLEQKISTQMWVTHIRALSIIPGLAEWMHEYVWRVYGR